MSRHVIGPKNEAQNLDRTQRTKQTSDYSTNSESRDNSHLLLAWVNRFLNNFSRYLKSNDNLTAPLFDNA